MGLKDLLDRIKLSFCCKSKCSLNEVVEQINEGQEWVDELQEDLQDVVSSAVSKQVPMITKDKQYNYYSKKEY
tara:strand:- start:675 stop:893 length:219 start_codon:yes stop_codon:yes gene_type:complete